jgi:hypothetical protein
LVGTLRPAEVGGTNKQQLQVDIDGEMDYICAVWEQGRNAQYLTNTGESSLSQLRLVVAAVARVEAQRMMKQWLV